MLEAPSLARCALAEHPAVDRLVIAERTGDGPVGLDVPDPALCSVRSGATLKALGSQNRSPAPTWRNTRRRSVAPTSGQRPPSRYSTHSQHIANELQTQTPARAACALRDAMGLGRLSGTGCRVRRTQCQHRRRLNVSRSSAILNGSALTGRKPTMSSSTDHPQLRFPDAVGTCGKRAENNQGEPVRKRTAAAHHLPLPDRREQSSGNDEGKRPHLWPHTASCATRGAVLSQRRTRAKPLAG